MIQLAVLKYCSKYRSLYSIWVGTKGKCGIENWKTLQFFSEFGPHYDKSNLPPDYEFYFCPHPYDILGIWMHPLLSICYVCIRSPLILGWKRIFIYPHSDHRFSIIYKMYFKFYNLCQNDFCSTYWVSETKSSGFRRHQPFQKWPIQSRELSFPKTKIMPRWRYLKMTCFL